MARRVLQSSPETMDAAWLWLRTGHAAKPAARQLGLSTSTVRTICCAAGDPSRATLSCFAPAEVRRAGRDLSRSGCRSVAAGYRGTAGSAPSTITREVTLAGGRSRYRAHRSDHEAWSRATRPKPCKLPRPGAACHRGGEASASLVAAADRWLAETHPSRDPEMQVSHESIYRSLLIQSRGVLRRELTAYGDAGLSAGPKESGCPTGVVGVRTRCTSPRGQ